MKRTILTLLALFLLGLGIYFSRNTPLMTSRIVATPSPATADSENAENMMTTFHVKAQKANALMVAFDDQELECAKNKMQISALSQQTRMELDELAKNLIASADFSKVLQNYINECSQDCTCSVLSVFTQQLEMDPQLTEKFKNELDQIKSTLELNKNESAEVRKACATNLGDLCDVVKVAQ